MEKTRYKDAGVDLDVYQESMSRLGKLLHRTHTPRVMPLPGGFAGLFQLDFESPLFKRHYEDPVLIACTDGVGTKLKVAIQAGRHDTVGIDLVAMCVNDCICCGAEPLFFLDYVAMSRDDPEQLEAIVEGISQGCVESDSVLLGGETAIMPDVYHEGEYDLAGFCVGVADRKRLIEGRAITPGDTIIGIASSGLHSNGYSLVRKIVFEKAGLSIDDHVDALGQTVSEALLTPTRLYVRPTRAILSHYKKKNVVHGIAHITGGGLLENVERILPANCNAAFERNSWTVPPVFPWLQELGNVDEDETERVFNMGLGLVLVVGSYFADSIRHQLQEFGLESWNIGTVTEGDGTAMWGE